MPTLLSLVLAQANQPGAPTGLNFDPINNLFTSAFKSALIAISVYALYQVFVNHKISRMLTLFACVLVAIVMYLLAFEPTKVKGIAEFFFSLVGGSGG